MRPTVVYIDHVFNKGHHILFDGLPRQNVSMGTNLESKLYFGHVLFSESVRHFHITYQNHEYIQESN